jgi:hypothetical protein
MTGFEDAEMYSLILALLWPIGASGAWGPSPDGEDDDRLPFTLAEDLPLQELPGDALQAAPQPPQNPPPDSNRSRANDDALAVNVGARGRFTVPFGAADRSYSTYAGGFYVVDHYLSWADFFNPGWGFDVEADVFLGRKNPGVNWALALLAETDQYYGTKNTDGFGDTLSVGDMTAGSLQIGGRVMDTFRDGFYFGGLLAIGAIHYSAVEGTFSGPVFLSFKDTIFRDTWTVASTFRADGGYRFGAVAIVGGIGMRIMGPPSEGPRFSMNSGAFWSFDLSLGAEIGF